mgnify:CR=1 FL=1
MKMNQSEILHAHASILGVASDDTTSIEECEQMIQRAKDFLAKALEQNQLVLVDLGETTERIELLYSNTRANFEYGKAYRKFKAVT